MESGKITSRTCRLSPVFNEILHPFLGPCQAELLVNAWQEPSTSCPQKVMIKTLKTEVHGVSQSYW
jgi:hypothetical protein